jgi:hypothetical protein
MRQAPSASLLPTDIDMFGRLGIPPDLLSAARVQRVTDREARDHFGIRFSKAKDVGGIVFPYYIPAVEYRVTARLRRDKPEIDENGKPQNKYISPWGDSRHLYYPPGAKQLLDDPATIIVLVESEKAALALTAWAKRMGIKLVALAMGGCWGWRGQRVRSKLAPTVSALTCPARSPTYTTAINARITFCSIPTPRLTPRCSAHAPS